MCTWACARVCAHVWHVLVFVETTVRSSVVSWAQVVLHVQVRVDTAFWASEGPGSEPEALPPHHPMGWQSLEDPISAYLHILGAVPCPVVPSPPLFTTLWGAKSARGAGGLRSPRALNAGISGGGSCNTAMWGKAGLGVSWGLQASRCTCLSLGFLFYDGDSSRYSPGAQRGSNEVCKCSVEAAGVSSCMPLSLPPQPCSQSPGAVGCWCGGRLGCSWSAGLPAARAPCQPGLVPLCSRSTCRPMARGAGVPPARRQAPALSEDGEGQSWAFACPPHQCGNPGGHSGLLDLG